MDVIACAKCKIQLPDDPPGGVRMHCPQCGSTARDITILIEDVFNVYVGYRDKLKRPSLPSAKKLRSESYSRVEPSHKYGKLVRVERMIDKDRNLYNERVINLQSGEVLHECKEPLSEHTGHGTAKAGSQS